MSHNLKDIHLQDDFCASSNEWKSSQHQISSETNIFLLNFLFRSVWIPLDLSSEMTLILHIGLAEKQKGFIDS